LRTRLAGQTTLAGNDGNGRHTKKAGLMRPVTKSQMPIWPCESDPVVMGLDMVNVNTYKRPAEDSHKVGNDSQ
jgi:hypothetical protein